MPMNWILNSYHNKVSLTVGASVRDAREVKQSGIPLDLASSPAQPDAAEHGYPVASLDPRRPPALSATASWQLLLVQEALRRD